MLCVGTPSIDAPASEKGRPRSPTGLVREASTGTPPHPAPALLGRRSVTRPSPRWSVGTREPGEGGASAPRRQGGNCGSAGASPSRSFPGAWMWKCRGGPPRPPTPGPGRPSWARAGAGPPLRRAGTSCDVTPLWAGRPHPAPSPPGEIIAFLFSSSPCSAWGRHRSTLQRQKRAGRVRQRPRAGSIHRSSATSCTGPSRTQERHKTVPTLARRDERAGGGRGLCAERPGWHERLSRSFALPFHPWRMDMEV